jgi:hypothetical protein
MPEDSMVNGDGFNSDSRTFMLHDTVTALGQQSDECSVFMVVGLPLKAVAKASLASFACQVSSLKFIETDIIVTLMYCFTAEYLWLLQLHNDPRTTPLKHRLLLL